MGKLGTEVTSNIKFTKIHVNRPLGIPSPAKALIATVSTAEADTAVAGIACFSKDVVSPETERTRAMHRFSSKMRFFVIFSKTKELPKNAFCV